MADDLTIDPEDRLSYSELGETLNQSRLDRLRSEDERLDRDIDDLENKIRAMKEKIEKQESYTSASHDARKMYGDLTPGDQTHQDAILLYQNHFKEAFHKMPSSFKEQSKYKVWQMCANIMQDCFDEKKKEFIEIMKKDMKSAVSQDVTIPEVDEKTRDLYRAFKMMIAEVDDEKLLLRMKQKNPDLNEDSFHFVMDMIRKLEPIHYKSFLTKGKLNETSLEPLPEI